MGYFYVTVILKLKKKYNNNGYNYDKIKNQCENEKTSKTRKRSGNKII